MRLSHLLAVVMLLSFCAGQLSAQSQSNASRPVASRATPAANTSDTTAPGQFRLSPYPQLDFIAQDSRGNESGIHVDADQSADRTGEALSQLQLQVSRQKWFSQSDFECYAIRSYLVVRESPHSDVTHRDGYTTCVPANRVRMYTTIYHPR
jgi:hypothetical protein